MGPENYTKNILPTQKRSPFVDHCASTQFHADHGPTGHEVYQIVEKGLALMLLVKFLGLRLTEMQHFQSLNLEIVSFDDRDNLAFLLTKNVYLIKKPLPK